jgi:hypothetical protein
MYGRLEVVAMLNKDYREMLQLLLEENVRFLVVGAYALSAHGYPRATADIDIWIEPTLENARKVMQVLHRFGSPLFDVTPEDFSKEGTIFQIGVIPRRIDLITAIDGVDFPSADSKKMFATVDDLYIPVLSIEDLITNKISTGREKDALDVTMLKRHLSQ